MFLEHCLKHPNIRVCTSVFTLLEIASAIRRQVGKRDVYQYLYNIHVKYKEGQVEWLFPSKVKTTYDLKKLIDELVKTAIENRTPAGDTIHVYTMINNRIKTLITWDKDHFKGLKRRNILTPEEFMLEEQYKSHLSAKK
jgi:predicted nucleic acid-binding protein